MIFHSLRTENVSLMRQSIKVPEQLLRCQKSLKRQMHHQLRGNTEFLCAAYKPHTHTVPSDEHVHKIPLRATQRWDKKLLRSEAPWLRQETFSCICIFTKQSEKLYNDLPWPLQALFDYSLLKHHSTRDALKQAPAVQRGFLQECKRSGQCDTNI